ncbi:MAG: hypothetical protein AB7I33_08485 [Gemmatimonadales bacterium]
MGATAGAVIMLKEKQIVSAFREAGAVSPDRGRNPGEIGVREHLAFQRLRRRDVLRESGPGLYYVDVERWESLRDGRRRLALVLLIAAAAMLLIGLRLAR